MKTKTKLKLALIIGSIDGICYLVSHENIITREKIQKFINSTCIAKGWHSGVKMFPIADPGGADPGVAYRKCFNTFNPFSKYCRRRRTIAKLILKEFYNG